MDTQQIFHNLTIKFLKLHLAKANSESHLEIWNNPVDTPYWGDIGFLLDLHHDIDRLRIVIEVTSLYDIFFQYYNDVAAIT